MKVTFLGTGTSHGVPMLLCSCCVCRSKNPKDQRLRPSVYLTVDDKHILIDICPDFRQQSFREEISRVDAILLTHEHKDHTNGLDDIRPFFYRQKAPIPLYGRNTVLNQLHREYEYIFSESYYLGAPQFVEFTIENQPFLFENIEIIPIEFLHGNLKIFGFRIGDFAYLTDASFVPDVEKKKLKNLKILVVNALRIESHGTHFSLQEAIDFAKELQPETTYLTHISHQLGLHKTISQQLPANVFLAYDGLTLGTNE